MQYPKFNLITSMDYIVLVIHEIEFNALKNIIPEYTNSKYICSKKFDPNKYVYDYSEEYQIQGFEKTLRLFNSSEMNFRPILMKIEKPNMKTLNLIHNFAVENQIQYHISSMELTFDFFTKNIDTLDAMYSMLVQHVYLKWAGKSFENDYETTTYIGNPRKTISKAIRIYKKEYEDKKKDRARLELILKRRLLKRQNIESITDLEKDVYYQIVNKYIKFKDLRLNVYEKKYLRKLRKQNKALTDDQLQDKVDIELDTVKQICNQKGIVEAFRHIQKQVSGEYECFKGYDFHDVFFNRIINKNFC